MVNVDTTKPIPKKAPKKATGKKPSKTPKKVTKRAVRKTAVKKTVKKSAVKATEPEKIEVKAGKSSKTVKLPNNMSPRAVEKAAVLNKTLDEYISKSIYRVAYVASICYLLIGSALVLSQFFAPNTSISLLSTNFTANTGDTTIPDPTTTNPDGTTSTTGTDTPPPPPPEFRFLEPIPDQISEPYRTTFVVTNAEKVLTKLVKVGQVGFFDIEVNSLLEGKYRALIPAANLGSGIYQLRIYVDPLNGDNIVVFQSQEFEITSDLMPTIPPPDPDETATTTDNTDPDPDGTDPNTDPTDTNPDETSTTTDNPVADEVPMPPVVEDPAPDTETEPFAFLIPEGTVLSGNAFIKLSVPIDFPWVELYARPVNSLDRLFVTLAREQNGHKYFAFDSTNLPNGEYELTARTIFENQPYRSKPVKVVVKNFTRPVPEPLPPVSDTTNDTNPEQDTTTTNERETVNIQEPSFVPPPPPDLSQQAEDESEKLFSEHADDLDTLFVRYASAQQSGDQTLIREAREAIKDKRKELAKKALENRRTRDISDDIDERLEARLNDLEERVETFEQLRKEKSKNETAVDTDKDGISDYDEINLYGTDPEQPDSDNDGFNDGIEIVRGYDPTDAASEAVIEFESPRESVGLVREDVLVVDEVLPILPIEEAEEVPVKAEIRGRGLPNSFVTLYIYSTPTVVTVRTDADGKFVYTFDKELDDGQHDVYVAITDNAGEIIAQSNPFTFIKEAEAFTLADAAEDDLVSIEPIIEQTKNDYKTVLGLAILAFGLILLMLGISLRPKKGKAGETGSGSDGEEEV